MTIVKYIRSDDIVVQFENGVEVKTEYKHFKSGSVKNPFHKSVYGVGYIGVGCYKPTINGKSTEHYKCWKA